jgi:hypothetical protein
MGGSSAVKPAPSSFSSKRATTRQRRGLKMLKQQAEDNMLVADLIHSCSNEMVAQAALSCIGGRFAERVRTAAQEKGMSVGRFVAAVVRNFARRADEGVRDALRERINGVDQPLLMGLRAVLEPALEDGALFVDDDLILTRPVPVGLNCAAVHQYQ